MIFSIILNLYLLSSIRAFLPQPSFFQALSTSTNKKVVGAPTGAETALSCICINCARVTNCAAYHFVETKHEQPHMTEHPTFNPRDGSPTIHVNIRTVRRNSNEQLARVWEEHQQQTATATTDDSGQLHGEKTYDLMPQTTYEYDVVACADYVEDLGCWVRNMPEEIKLANPHFVPT